MPRHPNEEPKAEFRGWVPESLSNKIDLLLLDPFTGKTIYAAKTKLIEHLLRKWLKEVQQNNGDLGITL